MMMMTMLIMMTMMMIMIRMEIKDVCELMDEGGNFKLSRPTTFLNIRHYSYIYMLMRIIMMMRIIMLMIYDDNEVQTFQTNYSF